MTADRPSALAASAERLSAGALLAAGVAPNEANLRHEIELLLRGECAALGIPYAPFNLERALRGDARTIAFADVVHGGVIIEYEPPRSFGGGRKRANIAHAKDQAEDYAARMAHEEGRPIGDYVLVVFDGAHIAFGAVDGPDGGGPSAGDRAARWERLLPFDAAGARRLLTELEGRGRPLVHPALLRCLVGPESAVGEKLIPALFTAVAAATAAGRGQSGTALLFAEWRRLFGQAVGIPTDRLRAFLLRQSDAHGVPYGTDVPCYLFALHTHIALVAKLVAALALPHPSEDIRDAGVPLIERIRTLESGTLFADAGIVNMLGGDFFSWPAEDAAWPAIETPLAALLDQLGHMSFDMTHRDPGSVRDLFKGIYEQFVPRELRHALGEVYTPDWLAAHTLDRLDWRPEDDLLDPTCGTGTFLLEALRRRLIAAGTAGARPTAAQLLAGLAGMDLNPLAVLSTKASMVVILAQRLDPADPVRLPVFLSDAINTATVDADGDFVHRLQTEADVRVFRVPEALVRSGAVHAFFDRMRLLIVSGCSGPEVMAGLAPFLADLEPARIASVAATVAELLELYARSGGQGRHWEGLWCPILADRFAAGAIGRVSHIAGNPPWVKWSHLPPAYAAFVKPLCQTINVFSQDRYVGGIEADISTIITFIAIRTWLADGGRLGFVITATLFSNESSQGFRRFANPDGTPMAAVLAVEDFKELRPFEGVSNHPALLLLEQGRATRYPVPYRLWLPPVATDPAPVFTDGRSFRAAARFVDLVAEPVAGTDAGPWLKGTPADHALWQSLFDAGAPSAYVARKGVTTDRNGIYFLRLGVRRANGLVPVANDPDGAGRTAGIARLSMDIEADHLFPLLRGRGLSAFRVVPDPDYRILVAQRGMHGDPALMTQTPRTLRFLSRFREELEKRASYRRFQKGKPFWSTWSTGPYSFSPFKVLWKEMSGGRFCAAYVGSIDDPVLGPRVAVPDHKLYMVALETEEEARYLTGFLNAPTVAGAVGAYAAALSLGTSVIEYLRIPRFDPADDHHRRIAALAGAITDRQGTALPAEMAELDRLAIRVATARTDGREAIRETGAAG